MIKRLLKRIVKTSVVICISVVLVIAALLTYITVTDYRPQGKIDLKVENNRQEILKTKTPVSMLTFNIGYCGLDKGEDFFMDGGTMSRSSSKVQTLTNLNNISAFLAGQKADFMLLQEVDVKSSRSFSVNQLENMQAGFKEYGETFGINYKVPWVPVPLTSPMGAVLSGITTFSRYEISSSSRYQYPGSEKWPTQLFELDRCFVENRIPVEGGKELVLINSHLSAFDKGGEIRKQQLTFLKTYITGEYAKGNYVIAGGDWNHALPGTDPKLFKTTEDWPFWLQNLPADFTPEGFKWGVDKTIPTNRTNAKPYVKDENFTVVIDGFLVSPNVEIQKVAGHDLGFESSDHNPVTGIFVLK